MLWDMPDTSPVSYLIINSSNLSKNQDMSWNLGITETGYTRVWVVFLRKLYQRCG
jgi:hypothetical protein